MGGEGRGERRGKRGEGREGREEREEGRGKREDGRGEKGGRERRIITKKVSKFSKTPTWPILICEDLI
jgi:hypothetical protein